MTLVVNTGIALVHYIGMDNSDVLPAYTGSAPPNPLPNHALSAVHCTALHRIRLKLLSCITTLALG